MSSSLPDAYYTTRFLLEDEPSPLPGCFAIITAYNPMDRLTSEEENEQADRKLKEQLENRGLSHFRVIGQAPDRSHHESGWAIDGTLVEATELARSFDQRALWWVEGDILQLFDCRALVGERIGRFSARIDAA